MSQSSTASPPQAPSSDSVSFIDRFNVHPLLFAAICLGFIFGAYHIVGSGIAFVVVGAKITRENANAVRIITTLSQIVFILGPTFFFARLLSRRPGNIFLWRMPGFREFTFMLLALLSLQQILEVIMFLQELIPLPDWLQNVLGPMREMFRSMMKTVVKAETVPELVFVIAIAAVVPSFVEEMLFRGVIQTTIERLVEPLPAALVTGIIFGFFHLDPFNVIPLVVIGCYLGFLRVRSKSIVLPIAAHFLNNLAAVLAVYVGMGYETKLSTTELGFSETVAACMQGLGFGFLFVISFRAYMRATQSLP